MSPFELLGFAVFAVLILAGLKWCGDNITINLKSNPKHAKKRKD